VAPRLCRREPQQGRKVFANVTELLLAPVRLAIELLFVFSLFETGRLLVQSGLRYYRRRAFRSADVAIFTSARDGYPIVAQYARNPGLSLDELDVLAMRQLEAVRIATRTTPMLGLMATLIPMGPALVALTKNDTAHMSDLLRSAFSSVVLALASACVCFWIASVRRRWCAEELIAIKRRAEKTR